MTERSANLDAALRAGRVLLQSLAELCERLDDEGFRRIAAPGFPASVGAHIRHIQDHVRAALDGAEDGFIAYDRDGTSRRRGSPVETDRSLCRQELRELAERLDAFSRQDGAVQVEKILVPGEDPVVLESSLAREFAFVMHHSVHHNAVIAAQLRSLGYELPADFGVAPATLARQMGR